jgi:flagellar basal body-associated protein FliL
MQYGPQSGYYQGYGTAAPKKKRKGLIIGLIAGIVVLLGGAAALYFLVFAGLNIAQPQSSAESAVLLRYHGARRTARRAMRYTALRKAAVHT